MKSSNTLKPNTEEKSPDSAFCSHSSRIKSLWSSLMPLFLNLKNKLKPTRSQPKPELVPFHQLTLPSPLAQPVWIHLKSTSSTPSTSQQRSSRVKSKSPRISKCAQLERRSRHQKLLFWRSSTWNHSNMVWRSLKFMTMEPLFLSQFTQLTQLLYWLHSNRVSRTWLDCHLKLDTQLKPQFHWSLETLSRTSLLYQLSQGTILIYGFRFKIAELSLISSGSSQPVQQAAETKAPVKVAAKEEKPAKKEEPKEEEEDTGMGGLFDWFFKTNIEIYELIPLNWISQKSINFQI